jgi:hypothetical protein
MKIKYLKEKLGKYDENLLLKICDPVGEFVGGLRRIDNGTFIVTKSKNDAKLTIKEFIECISKLDENANIILNEETEDPIAFVGMFLTYNDAVVLDGFGGNDLAAEIEARIENYDSGLWDIDKFVYEMNASCMTREVVREYAPTVLEDYERVMKNAISDS